MAEVAAFEQVDLEKKIQEQRQNRGGGAQKNRRFGDRSRFPQFRRQQQQFFQRRQQNFSRGPRPRYERPQIQRPRYEKRVNEHTYGHKDPQPNVVIKGLGSFITDQKLRELCQTYGAMDMCKLDRDSFGNVRAQGLGLVKYERYDDARKMANELNGVKIVEDQDHQNTGGQISVKLVNKNDRSDKRDRNDKNDRKFSDDRDDNDDNERNDKRNNNNHSSDLDQSDRSGSEGNNNFDGIRRRQGFNDNRRQSYNNNYSNGRYQFRGRN